jgi:drug/metabolite transporter (DMT)-like permease
MSVHVPAAEQPEARHHLAGLGWMLLAQGCFAVMNVSARVAGGDLPWPEVAASRFLVGALMAWLFARSRGVSLRIADQRTSWGRAVFGTASALCTFYALTSPRIHLGDAVTLGATAPIFVALLAPWFLGEPRSRMVGVSVLIAFAGVVLLLQPKFESAAWVAGVATMGALFYAFAMMLLRRLGPGESSEAVVLHFSLVAMVTTALLSLAVWRTPTMPQAVLLLFTGLAGGGGQLAMTRAYALEGAARVAVLTYLGILFTVLLAIPMFGERPSLMQAAGGLAIVGAGLLLTRSVRPMVAED